ncbi:Type IIS restriction enzyme Eco57I, partial [termite gut metagenome]
MKDFQSLYHPELLKDETNAITEETEDLFETTVKEDLDEKAKEKKYAKANGKVPSPNFLVKTTLDLAGYQGQKILQKHVIDNSCGEGNFLVEIMRRYCLAFFEVNQDEKQLKYELETYLHGVEIDHLQVYNCRVNLNIALREFSLIWVKWDLWDEDATKVKFFNGKMDYVFANPPYVRSRYFSIDTSHYANFRYAQQGNSDLYLIFYEIGIEMLNETGVLGYISPCSIYNSLAGSAFRRDILELKLLSKVVNFEHYQWFKVATYTTIMILDRLHRDELMDYYRFNPKTLQLYLKDQLSYSQIAIDGIIYLGDKVNLALIKEIIETSKSVLPKLLVKNGIATTCDRFFVRS